MKERSSEFPWRKEILGSLVVCAACVIMPALGSIAIARPKCGANSLVATPCPHPKSNSVPLDVSELQYPSMVLNRLAGYVGLAAAYPAAENVALPNTDIVGPVQSVIRYSLAEVIKLSTRNMKDKGAVGDNLFYRGKCKDDRRNGILLVTPQLTSVIRSLFVHRTCISSSL